MTHASKRYDQLGGRRILLVEDNDFNQQITRELLLSVEAVVTIAENGKQAVDLVQAYPFDAVLMDIRMPGMDGCEATRQIRAMGRFDAMPIIAMTAHAMTTDHENCLEAGMNDYVRKPIEPEELYTVLGKWLVHGGTEPSPSPSPNEGSHETASLPFSHFSLPGISISQGLKHAFGRIRFFEESLIIFMKTKRRTACEMRTALARRDNGSAALIAHSMKTVAGTIGAVELADAANMLEKAIDAGAADALERHLAAYEQHLSIVIAGLDEAFASSRS